MNRSIKILGFELDIVEIAINSLYGVLLMKCAEEWGKHSAIHKIYKNKHNIEIDGKQYSEKELKDMLRKNL